VIVNTVDEHDDVDVASSDHGSISLVHSMMQYLTTRMLLWPTTRTTIAEEGRPKTKTSHYPISPASSLVVFFDAVSDDEEDNSVADIDGYTAPTEGLHGRPSEL